MTFTCTVWSVAHQARDTSSVSRMTLPDGLILCFPKLIVMPSDLDDEDHTDAIVLTHLTTSRHAR